MATITLDISFRMFSGGGTSSKSDHGGFFSSSALLMAIVAVATSSVLLVAFMTFVVCYRRQAAERKSKPLPPTPSTTQGKEQQSTPNGSTPVYSEIPKVFVVDTLRRVRLLSKAKMAKPVPRNEAIATYNDEPRSGVVHAYAQSTLFTKQITITSIDEKELSSKHAQLSTSALIPNPAYGVGIEAV